MMYDQMRNEIYDNQKTLLIMYESLFLLWEQLKVYRKDFPTSDINLLAYGDVGEIYNNKNATKAHNQFHANSKIVKNLNKAIKQLCKFVMIKWLQLVQKLEEMSEEPNHQEKIQETINSVKHKNCLSIANSLMLIQDKLNDKKQILANAIACLQKTCQKNTINKLKKELDQMEEQTNNNKITVQNYINNNNLYYEHVRSLKIRTKETEVKLRNSETQLRELQNAIKY